MRWLNAQARVGGASQALPSLEQDPPPQPRPTPAPGPSEVR